MEITLMLEINQSQIDQFNLIMFNQFVEKTKLHLHELFPEKMALLDEDIIHEKIMSGKTKAKIYSITSERDVVLFIALSIVLGDNFDKAQENQWIQAILVNSTLMQQEKMDLIYARLDA